DLYEVLRIHGVIGALHIGVLRLDVREVVTEHLDSLPGEVCSPSNLRRQFRERVSTGVELAKLPGEERQLGPVLLPDLVNAFGNRVATAHRLLCHRLVPCSETGVGSERLLGAADSAT